jgi:dUTPase
MRHLLVELLDPRALSPTVAFRGEDLGYDVYALEDTFIMPGVPTKIRTGIAAVYLDTPWYPRLSEFLFDRALIAERKFGLEVEDRSGNAAKFGLHCLAGKIDAGYRGEILVVMMLLGNPVHQQGEPGELATEDTDFDQEAVESAIMGLFGTEDPPPYPSVRKSEMTDTSSSSAPEYDDGPEELDVTFSGVQLGTLLGPEVIPVDDLGEPLELPVFGYQVRAGDKIAQLLPRPVLTGRIKVVKELPKGVRGPKGFGSTGR